MHMKLPLEYGPNLNDRMIEICLFCGWDVLEYFISKEMSLEELIW